MRCTSETSGTAIQSCSLWRHCPMLMVIPHAYLLTCLLAYLSAPVCMPVRTLSLLTCTLTLLHAARAHAAGLHHISSVLHVTSSFVMGLISHTRQVVPRCGNFELNLLCRHTMMPVASESQHSALPVVQCPSNIVHPFSLSIGR